MSTVSVESGYASHSDLKRAVDNQHHRSNEETTSVADHISGCNECSESCVEETKDGMDKHPSYLHSVKEHGRSDTLCSYYSIPLCLQILPL